MLRVDRENISFNLARVPRYIHQDLPGHDPQPDGPRPYGPRRLHLLDRADDAADDFFRVGGAEGAVGAVDGGLDDRFGVFDRVDEGGVRGGVALGDAEARVVAQLRGEFGGIAEEGCDVVLLAEARCEGSGADSAWGGRSRLVSDVWFGGGAWERARVPAAPMMRIFMEVVVEVETT